MNAILKSFEEQPFVIPDEPSPMILTNWAAPDYEPIFLERMRRLQNIRTSENPEATWTGLREFYKDDPVKFINDWGMTVDPRNPEIGLPAAVPFILFHVSFCS